MGESFKDKSRDIKSRTIFPYPCEAEHAADPINNLLHSQCQYYEAPPRAHHVDPLPMT